MPAETEALVPDFGPDTAGERKSLANRLRKIARGEWTLAGDEAYLLRAADLLERADAHAASCA